MVGDEDVSFSTVFTQTPASEFSEGEENEYEQGYRASALHVIEYELVALVDGEPHRLFVRIKGFEGGK